MRPFRDLPIQRKLTSITMLTTSVALLLACAGIAAFDRIAAREQMARELSLVARNIGNASNVPLELHIPETAQSNLQLLSLLPNIVSADLFAADGQPFAHYQRKGVKNVVTPAPAAEGYQFSDQFLDVYQDVRRE